MIKNKTNGKKSGSGMLKDVSSRFLPGSNVEIIHDYLKNNNIIPIGRFGEWEYYNMDKALLSGKNAASRISGDA